MRKNALVNTRQDNYPEWYQEVIRAAELAENSDVRGCMVIKPWGYAIWELLQSELDSRLKATGHQNAYFPLLIPLSQLEKEAQHIDGFAKECAVVTHHRLVSDSKGGLKPDGKLSEPFVIRPTSETMIGSVFSKWVHSYRDLPLLINQWANVMRWEMRTRLFLRSSEFLWQEGHTAHASKKEALDETLLILDLYSSFIEDMLAMPVVVGEKTEKERFPGAVSTYCVEAMMQDGKALQAGTSHFLGQNFSKAYDIEFSDNQEKKQFAWTTSWGVSTRLIGGLIMTHSDDDGLVLPPSVAPHQVVILPILNKAEKNNLILECAEQIKRSLEEMSLYNKQLRCHIDTREIRGGEKKWSWVKKGIPIILEIGPKDLETSRVALIFRNKLSEAKKEVGLDELQEFVVTKLDAVQSDLLATAQGRLSENTIEVTDIDSFKEVFSEKGIGRFVQCYSSESEKVDEIIKPLNVSARCIPATESDEIGTCIFSGETVNTKIIYARAY